MSEQILEQAEAEERNPTLDHAEQRAAMPTEAQAQQVKAVEAVRREIGRETYDTAKKVLPTLEYAIRTQYRPFVARVVAMAQQANKPVPDQMRQWLTAIDAACDSCPRSLRHGIAAYDSLSFAAIAWTDGRTIDSNKRAEQIATIRQLLRNHDGMLSFLKSQKEQLEFFIRQSNWPR
jgi:hypothetical protein